MIKHIAFLLIFTGFISGCSDPTNLIPLGPDPLPTTHVPEVSKLETNKDQIRPNDGRSVNFGIGQGTSVPVKYWLVGSYVGKVWVRTCLSVDGVNVFRDSCSGTSLSSASGIIRNNPGMWPWHNIRETNFIHNYLVVENTTTKEETILVEEKFEWKFYFQ